MRAQTANVSKTGSMRVAVLTYPNLGMFEFAVACEVFGSPETLALGIDWYDLVVCGEDPLLRFDNGMTLQVPKTLSGLRGAHTIVLPPCDFPELVSDTTLPAIRRAHARGVRIVSLCTGALVLARTGLLDGRRAVTHWTACEAFAAAHPAVTVDPTVLYVDDGDILTSAGSAASIDLCLHVVRLDRGADAVNRLARHMVVQPHREGGQAQYIDAPIPPARAEAFADVLAYMSEHLDEPLSVPELARRSAMSPRTFARHFAATTGSTPYRWLLRQRVQLAQRLLERSDLPVESVATHAGLGDAANLRKHFRRQLGTSPDVYRRTFAQA